MKQLVFKVWDYEREVMLFPEIDEKTGHLYLIDKDSDYKELASYTLGTRKGRGQVEILLWTGREDVNGEKVFEGDIHGEKWYNEDRGEVKVEIDEIPIIYIDGSFHVELSNGKIIPITTFLITTKEKLNIIGTIYKKNEDLKKIYFHFYDQIQDHNFSDKCKSYWDYSYSILCGHPSNVKEAVDWGFDHGKTKEGYDYFQDSKRLKTKGGKNG